MCLHEVHVKAKINNRIRFNGPKFADVLIDVHFETSEST